MPTSIIRAYENGTLKQLQEQWRAEQQPLTPEIETRCYDYEDQDDSEPWCDECHNMGTINCYCGGDLCVCENYGEMPCPKCGG